MSTSAGYVAVVTGASGYVASEIVAQLLAKGYDVRATVRSIKDASKVSHLKGLGEVLSGTLTLHEADLLQPGAFDKIFEGADLVLHTASPYKTGVDAESLIKPAVEGTRTVMHSVIKNKATVKRVILTSSFAAIVKPRKGPGDGRQFFNEADWNDEAKADKESGYFLSKVLAEKEAWQIAEANGIDLVTICPSGIFGPVLSNRVDAESVQMVKAVIEGSDTLYPWQCDVRDVAAAHVLAAETPAAQGRYLVAYDQTVPDRAVLELLAERFPQYKFAQPQEGGSFERFASTDKVQKDLGLVITPWHKAVVDMAVALINRGIAQPVLRD